MFDNIISLPRHINQKQLNRLHDTLHLSLKSHVNCLDQPVDDVVSLNQPILKQVHLYSNGKLPKIRILCKATI